MKIISIETENYLSLKKEQFIFVLTKEHTSRSKTCDLNNFKPHFDCSECFSTICKY